MIWNNDDFFGGMFDFDGDGKTDAIEAALGYQILDEMSQSNENNKNQDEQFIPQRDFDRSF